jgi:hypothetical protein
MAGTSCAAPGACAHASRRPLRTLVGVAAKRLRVQGLDLPAGGVGIDVGLARHDGRRQVTACAAARALLTRLLALFGASVLRTARLVGTRQDADPI